MNFENEINELEKFNNKQDYFFAREVSQYYFLQHIQWNKKKKTEV